MRPARPVVIVLAALAAMACGSDGTGPTPVVTPEVLVSGTLEIPATYEADLDSGTLQTDARVDIWNESVDDNTDQLTVKHGARLLLMGTTAPDYAACAAAPLTDQPVALIGLATGNYFCVTTDEGRVARLELTKAPTTGDHNIDVTFTTWKLAD